MHVYIIKYESVYPMGRGVCVCGGQSNYTTGWVCAAAKLPFFSLQHTKDPTFSSCQLIKTHRIALKVLKTHYRNHLRPLFL